MFCPTCIIHTSLVSLAPGTDIYRLPNNLITPCIDVFIELEHTFTSVATHRIENAVVLTYDPELRKARCLPSPAFAKLVLVLHCSPVYGWGGVSKFKRLHASVPPVDDINRCTSCQQDLGDNVVVSDAQSTEFPLHITQWNPVPTISTSDTERLTPSTTSLTLYPTTSQDPTVHPSRLHDSTQPHLRIPSPGGPGPLFPTVPSFTSIQIQSSPPRKKGSAAARGFAPSFGLEEALVQERRKFLSAVIMRSASGGRSLCGGGVAGVAGVGHGGLVPSVSVECDVTEGWVEDGSGPGLTAHPSGIGIAGVGQQEWGSVETVV